MNYSVVDMENWKRAKLFSHYIDYMPIVMSLTVDMDVTPIKEYSKKTGMNFYHIMIWIVSKVINSHEEFRFGWSENCELIKWDFVSPSYTVFHKEDESFTKMLTEYCDDLSEFCKRVEKDIREHEADRAIVENHPANFFDVTCLPWVKYRHFDMHVFDGGKFLAPVVSWGKYEEENGRLIMPLTMNINHAVADGFHLSRFFNEVSELINTFDKIH